MTPQPPDPPPLARELGLLPHPEGGWYRRTWRTEHRFAPPGYPGERHCATGIHYLLGPGERSRWHRVRGDELWLWHRGVPLMLLLGGNGERPHEPPETVTLGPAVELGQHPQSLVPAGTWQSAHPRDTGQVLVSCVVSPGFDFDDFELL